MKQSLRVLSFSLLSHQGSILFIFTKPTNPEDVSLLRSFILSLSRSVSLLERVSGVGGEGPPRRGHCFPVFGRSRRFVTAACASGVDATPLPSGRGEG